jgi:hypothetical protein
VDDAAGLWGGELDIGRCVGACLSRPHEQVPHDDSKIISLLFPSLTAGDGHRVTILDAMFANHVA